MSDRSPAKITIYNVKGSEEEIAGILSGYSFSVNYDSSYETFAEEVKDGVTLVNDDLSIGGAYELGRELETLGVAYRASQDARYEYDGMVRMFTPELGGVDLSAAQDGDAMVEAGAVTKLIDVVRSYISGEIEADTATMHDLRAIVKEGDLITGHQWTLALKALEEQSRTVAA
jgi:hypothetical protein